VHPFTSSMAAKVNAFANEKCWWGIVAKSARYTCVVMLTTKGKWGQMCQEKYSRARIYKLFKYAIHAICNDNQEKGGVIGLRSKQKYENTYTRACTNSSDVPFMQLQVVSRGACGLSLNMSFLLTSRARPTSSATSSSNKA